MVLEQLNLPITISPAGAGSGKGEGPRETAGRSNDQCKRENEIIEDEEQRKALAWQI